MDHFEMVEKLRAKANVSYEDAKTALEASDWDLLDALVYLEKEGKMRKEEAASYTTKQEPRPEAAPVGEGAGGVFRRIFELIASLINRMNKVSLEARKKGKAVLTLPLSTFLLLLIFGFWGIVPLMIVGLFFGFTYRFQGSDAVAAFNKAMDKAAGVAENIRTGASGSDSGAGDK
ncbi:MAG: ubiquitin [Christensenellales bacterium]